MASICVQAADLATAAINAGALVSAGEFKAERSFAEWDDILPDWDKLHVDVVPVFDPKTELEDRETVRYDLSVDIAVRKRLGVDSQNQATGAVLIKAVDDLTSLVESIHDFFLTDRFGEGDITWQSSTIRSLYSRAQLREHRQFLGIVRLEFKAVKAI